MQWIEGKIIENIHWTENLFSLRIAAAVDKFSAGQFTSLALDINGERIARPYSFLSSPDQQPLEFFFYTATNGVLSNALVKLNPGESVWVRQQAHGFFTMDEVPDAQELWMIATGTGVAPFFSILGSATPWQRFEHIILVHAVRTAADLRYQHLIESYAENYPGKFSFQSFVSRESCKGALPGRVPAAIANGDLERAVGRQLDKEKSHVMLCGNPDMVKDTVELLNLRNMRKHRRRTPGHITVENYW